MLIVDVCTKFSTHSSDRSFLHGGWSRKRELIVE